MVVTVMHDPRLTVTILTMTMLAVIDGRAVPHDRSHIYDRNTGRTEMI
jgi:hypothetical protein